MDSPSGSGDARRVLERWAELPCALALLISGVQFVAACLLVLNDPGLLGTVSRSAYYPSWVFLLQSLVFAACGGFLLGTGRHDQRAKWLAAAMWILAAAYSGSFLKAGLPEASTLRPSSFGWWLLVVSPAAFQPFVLWSFARRFPSLTRRHASDSLVLGMCGLTLALAILLLVADPLRSSGLLVGLHGLLLPFGQLDTGRFWGWIAFFSLPVFPAIAWRTRLAVGRERRRSFLLCLVIILGSAPALSYLILLSSSSRLDEILRQPLPAAVAGSLIFPPLLTMPVAIAYLVVRHKVLRVRPLLQRVITYSLARSTVFAFAALPVAGLVLYLYQSQERALADLLARPGSITLMALTVAALVLAQVREPVLEAMDRRFFRAQYVRDSVLRSLVHKTRDVDDRFELAALVERELDGALQLERVALIYPPPASRGEPLDALALAASSPAAVARMASSSWSPQQDDECRWMGLPKDFGRNLSSLQIEAFAPLRSRNELIGLLVLGRRRSGSNLSADDLSFVAAVADSAGLRLEGLRSSDLAGVSSADGTSLPGARSASTQAEAPSAAFCGSCGAVFLATDSACLSCGGRPSPASLPLLLAGKFRLLKKIGQGGMGIVFEATDEELRRRVAIKSLPAMSGPGSSRLRAEARAMASVTHPNLALIYGAETYRTTPVLIIELMSGGTLARRLRERGRLPWHQVVDLGIVLAGAVAALHERRLLHRDIKPSNIAFDHRDQPKLLDFGLSELLREIGPADAGSTPHKLKSRDWESRSLQSTLDARSLDEGDPHSTLLTVANQVIGTPAYLSPEAARGLQPTPHFDLWSFSVVLLETLLGHNPWAAESVATTLSRICTREVGDLLPVECEAPPALLDYFRKSLHADPDLRFQSAAEVRARLDVLRSPSQITPN